MNFQKQYPAQSIVPLQVKCPKPDSVVHIKGYLRVPLKGYYKGTIRVPLKGYYEGLEFPKIRGTLFGVLMIGILFFRVLY